jgi:hypothetical protein
VVSPLDAKLDDRNVHAADFRRSKPDAQRFDVSLELDGSDTLASPHLPGFSIPIAEPFGDDGA